jgi:DNA adenine methylase
MRAHQTELFATEKISVTKQEPVNVASIPHRSPFRYPGGKTWFVPMFRHWLQSIDVKPRVLVEPFAGGGIISLTAIFENLVDHAVLIELDEDVAAVWQVIVDGGAESLAKRIQTFSLSVEAVHEEFDKPIVTLQDRAFKTILKNRTFHGGILAPGSGLIKNGEAGRGLASRWYPETLARRLSTLHLMRHKLTVLTGDAFELADPYVNDKHAAFFVDPPYSAGGKNAGKRLYKHFQLDHERLFDFCDSLAGDFLMTYDNADEVQKMAEARAFDTQLIAMKNTHHAEMTELIVGRHLGWIKRA